MALYKINGEKLTQLKISKFGFEKHLQKLCENNLEELFEVKFVATEFPFADEYSGRLDTIGIDKECNPVIVEYKLDQNSSVISQSLFYMDWLVNHRGDFERAVQQVLGNDQKVLWDNPKMIIVAQNYNKYDKYAVNRINYDIYLYKYTLYSTGEFIIENINTQENRKYVLNDKTRKNEKDNENIFNNYGLNHFLEVMNDSTKKIYEELDSKIMEISDNIEKRYKKIYIGYRTVRNFLEIQLKRNELVLYVLPVEYEDPKKLIEDVPESYKYTLNKRLFIKSIDEIEYALNIIKSSYESTL